MTVDVFSLSACGDPPWSLSDHPRELSSPPQACAVAIVGAGSTGLSAALALAKRGVETVVIDRCIGGGATLRSGGIVLGETLIGPDAAFDGCEQMLRSWIEDEGVACSAVWSSCLELSRDEQLPLPPDPWFDGSALRIANAVPGGTLDPGKLVEGLLAAVRRAGALVVGDATVTAVEAEADGARLTVNGVPTRAGRVLMAVDAMASRRGFDPWPQRTLTMALQTVAGPQLAAAIGLAGPFYTREAPLLWGRPLADGSLLFGRELIEWRGPALPDDWPRRFSCALERLTARVRGLHPALRQVEIQRAWAGPTARTVRGVPALVEDPRSPNILWAGGYGGHGLAQAFALGRIAANRIAASV